MKARATKRWRDPKARHYTAGSVHRHGETGHIRALTDWALDDQDVADRAIDLIGAAKADICFEITETTVIDNRDVALALIDRYAAAGIGISIDYGSGLSSPAYLN